MLEPKPGDPPQDTDQARRKDQKVPSTDQSTSSDQDSGMPPAESPAKE